MGYSQFLAAAVKSKRPFRSEVAAVRRVSSIGRRRHTMIRGAALSGHTALALQVSRDYIRNGHTVLYFDIRDTLLPFRLEDLAHSDFFIGQTAEPENIVWAARQAYKGGINDLLIVLDGFGAHRREWRLKKTLHNLGEHLARAHPGCSVLVTERHEDAERHMFWDDVIDIEIKRSITDLRDKIGHIASLSQRGKECEIYVDYRTGRISHSYEYAEGQVESGKATRAGNFEWDGTVKQGIWKFVRDSSPWTCYKPLGTK